MFELGGNSRSLHRKLEVCSKRGRIRRDRIGRQKKEEVISDGGEEYEEAETNF